MKKNVAFEQCAILSGIRLYGPYGPVDVMVAQRHAVSSGVLWLLLARVFLLLVLSLCPLVLGPGSTGVCLVLFACALAVKAR